MRSSSCSSEKISIKHITKLFFCYVTVVYALIATYVFQISETNAYTGLIPISISFVNICYLVAVILFAVIVEMYLVGNPSDFFISLYVTVVLISLATFYNVSGYISDEALLYWFFILALPIVSILIFENFIPVISFRGVFSQVYIDKIISTVLILALIVSYFNRPESAGFSIEDAYTRRLDGRDVYKSGSLLAYLLAMSMNGFTPYLAFKGMSEKRKMPAILALLCAVYFFWILGIKTPLALVFVSFLLAYLLRKNKLRYFTSYLLVTIILFFIFVVIEWYINDGFSLVAEFFFRRVFVLQAQLMGCYFDFINSYKNFNWNYIFGSWDKSFLVTYHIGYEYFGSLNANANTNAFIYALASKGLMSYTMSVFFVSFFFSLLNKLYLGTNNPSYIFIGFLYGYLIIEQSFTTALASSGVGILFLFSILANNSTDS